MSEHHSDLSGEVRTVSPSYVAFVPDADIPPSVTVAPVENEVLPELEEGDGPGESPLSRAQT